MDKNPSKKKNKKLLLLLLLLLGAGGAATAIAVPLAVKGKSHSSSATQVTKYVFKDANGNDLPAKLYAKTVNGKTEYVTDIKEADGFLPEGVSPTEVTIAVPTALGQSVVINGQTLSSVASNPSFVLSSATAKMGDNYFTTYVKAIEAAGGTAIRNGFSDGTNYSATQPKDASAKQITEPVAYNGEQYVYINKATGELKYSSTELTDANLISLASSVTSTTSAATRVIEIKAAKQANFRELFKWNAAGTTIFYDLTNNVFTDVDHTGAAGFTQITVAQNVSASQFFKNGDYENGDFLNINAAAPSPDVYHFRLVSYSDPIDGHEASFEFWSEGSWHDDDPNKGDTDPKNVFIGHHWLEDRTDAGKTTYAFTKTTFVGKYISSSATDASALSTTQPNDASYHAVTQGFANGGKYYATPDAIKTALGITEGSFKFTSATPVTLDGASATPTPDPRQGYEYQNMPEGPYFAKGNEYVTAGKVAEAKPIAAIVGEAITVDGKLFTSVENNPTNKQSLEIKTSKADELYVQ